MMNEMWYKCISIHPLHSFYQKKLNDYNLFQTSNFLAETRENHENAIFSWRVKTRGGRTPHIVGNLTSFPKFND